MKRIVQIFFLLWAYTVSVNAVPARTCIREILQPDGTLLKVVLVGDENFHSYYTLDGCPVSERDEGGFYYTEIIGNKICVSSYLAHNQAERGDTERLYVNNTCNHVASRLSAQWSEQVRMNNERRLERRARKTIGVPTSYIGKKKGLVILVEFANKQMLSKSPETIRRMFNEIGYDGNNHIGSVHDYFFSQSYGNFDLTFDVVGPVTVSHNYGYYGSNDTQYSGIKDKYPDRMVIEACQLANDFVDFADYDWNNDGEVNQVFIVYAGYGESTGGVSSTIWPHESSLSRHGNDPLILDDVVINTYACSNELDGSSGSAMMGIGVVCHEFSHCLGLPDLYDTNYSGGFGMSYFDLMDSGSHSGPNGRAERPYGYSAYERWFAGWLDLSEVENSQRIENLPDLQDEPKAYILRNDNDENEFFILENHQNVGWYQYVGASSECHGLMVTHVDFDQWAWSTNQVNQDKDHQRMSIIPADGNYGKAVTSDGQIYYYTSPKELEGDLFPGSSRVTELSNTTHWECGGHLFNANIDGGYEMNKAILNIQEEDGLLTFDVIMNMDVEVPIFQAPSQITETGFTISWSEAEEAKSYDLELTEYLSTRPYFVRTTLYSHIKGTSYDFANLAQHDYSLRIRANYHHVTSCWSERMFVPLLSDGVESIKNSNRQSSIYTTSGQAVSSPACPNVYIVRDSNGGYTKKFIHR